jgi:hypothetical protein
MRSKVMSDESWKPKCDDPKCRGWDVFNDREVQRCDTCDRFESDLDAFAFAVASDMHALRAKLQHIISARELERHVTVVLEDRHSVAYDIAYTGERDGGHLFKVKPLKGCGYGVAILDSAGAIHFSGIAS